MAGYIGSKAVLLSTTAATVTGAADIGGDLTVDTNTLYVDSTNNRVGVGTSSPSQTLDVTGGTSSTQARFGGTAGRGLEVSTATTFSTPDAVAILNAPTSTYGTMTFQTQSAERMRIDSSGNLLVGTTSVTPAVSNDSDGIALQSNGTVQFSANATTTAIINRKATDGDILQFRKDGTTVGNIGVEGSNLVIDGGSNSGFSFLSTSVRPRQNGALIDNVVDMGGSSQRFDDIYATNGTIQTSDRNEKTDIAELDEAEKRVAIAAKGLIRKYRWKDAVAEKGDDARIHVGIIAQDLQAAFAAEGLDAGRYAMFISSTWWEADEVIPAVDEVLDDGGNVVTEAQPERTVTHHYETAEEAPEGATERTRLGVRYPELLAFIIGAM